MHMRPVGTELTHADERTNERTDGQTDVTKLIVAFGDFAVAAKS